MVDPRRLQSPMRHNRCELLKNQVYHYTHYALN